MLHEIWRDVPGFPNYQVSSEGRARSNFRRSPRILKPRLQKGYYCIHAIVGGRDINIRLNRAICLAFLGEPEFGMVAAHNDGNPLNNKLSNLRWATQSENALDRTKHGRPYDGGENPNAKLTAKDVLIIRESVDSCAALGRRFGISKNQIWRIRNGHCWKMDVTTLRAEAERLAA